MVSQQQVLAVIDRAYPTGVSSESLANRLRSTTADIASALGYLQRGGFILIEAGLYYSRTRAVKAAIATAKSVSTVANELRYPVADVQARLDRLVILSEARRIIPDRLNPATSPGQEDLYKAL